MIQYNVLPPDLSLVSDEDTIRETMLKESFDAGEAGCRKEDCLAVHQSAITIEGTFIFFFKFSFFAVLYFALAFVKKKLISICINAADSSCCHPTFVK